MEDVGGRRRSGWAPVVLVPAVLLLDVVQGTRSWPIPVVALLDEPAHLATAWLGLTALAPRNMSRRTWWVVLVTSVAIDVDHIPMYLTDGTFSVGGGRPPTHSLLLAALFGALALAPRLRWLLGVAAGVVLHLARDIATGPGIPMLWPLTSDNVRLPYVAYAVLLAALGAIALVRRPSAVATTGLRES